jgi:hypothetical protein
MKLRLSEDYVSMVACEDEIDVALLNAIRESMATGRQSGELAAQFDIDHRDISRRIYRMNKRMEQKIGENTIEKHGHKWKLILQTPYLRHLPYTYLIFNSEKYPLTRSSCAPSGAGSKI